MKKISVIVAHPDDEVLGCGGTIAKLVKSGAQVRILFLADGVKSREGFDEKEITKRKKAAEYACKELGASGIEYGEFPDNRLDSVALLDITKVVENHIGIYKPDTILTHHVGDLNIDHRKVFESVITACRPQKDMPVKLVLSFEVPSSTEWQVQGAGSSFEPNWFIDITDFLECKIKSLQFYSDEIKGWPHPRSIEAIEHLAHWRGATVGCDAAEAFMLCRKINS
jgi:N-acetylglucosamine malate deacetylase 1